MYFFLVAPSGATVLHIHWFLLQLINILCCSILRIFFGRFSGDFSGLFSGPQIKEKMYAGRGVLTVLHNSHYGAIMHIVKNPTGICTCLMLMRKRVSIHVDNVAILSKVVLFCNSNTSPKKIHVVFTSVLMYGPKLAAVLS